MPSHQDRVRQNYCEHKNTELHSDTRIIWKLCVDCNKMWEYVPPSQTGIITNIEPPKE